MSGFSRVLALVSLTGCAAPAASPPSSTWEIEQAGAAAPKPRTAKSKPAQQRSSGATDKVVSETLALVSRVRGLPIRAPVVGKRMSREELHAEMVRMLAEDAEPEVIQGNTEVLFALDLVPWDFDFQDTIVKLYANEIAGFYDSKKNSMVLAADLSKDAERITLYHELVHALQDQYSEISDAVGKREEEDSDAKAARHAVLEGDATSAMIDVLAADRGLKPVRVTPEMLLANSVITKGAAHLEGVPPVLKRSMLAPYVDGLGFVVALRDRGGYPAVDRALKELPVSTEQILHVEKFLAKEPVLALPAIPGAPGLGEVLFRDVIGEQALRIAFEDGMSARAASAAASDWGGDRLAVFSAGEQRAVRWHLVFDSEPAAWRAMDALARLALRPELGKASSKSEQTLRTFTDARTAELAVQSGRLCQLRPQRGPFALVRRDRHIGVTLGPYLRTRSGVHSAGECSQALRWADELAHAR